MSNLLTLTKLSRHDPRMKGKLRLFHHTKNLALIESTAKIVRKAIHMECPPALAEEAIHGYRRADGTDEQAEVDFHKTDQPYHPVPRDYHYRRALRVCEKLFRPSKRLLPISFPDLRYYPWTLNVSAEAPFTGSKKWDTHLRQQQSEGRVENARPTFHNLYNEIFHQNRYHIHKIKNGLAPFWDKEHEPQPYLYSTLHTRAHLTRTGKPDKNRAVFGVPKLLLMAENMFIWPLQKEYLNKNVDSPMLWGFETFKGGWMKLWNKLSKRHFNGVISSDWSGFDHRALHEVIDDVHTMWRSWFDFNLGYEPSKSDTHDYSKTETKEWKIQNLWDWMTNAVKHTPILGQSGTFYQWLFNGIASGYQQTQLLDSFVNAIYILTCLSALGINIEADDFAIYVQGDDNLSVFAERVLHSNKEVFISNLATQAKQRFNAVLSTSKTTYGTSLNEVEILSYKNTNGIAYRDESELLAKLLYPERPRTYGALASASIGIASAAMGNSQYVYNTCRNVFNFIVNDLGIEPATDPNEKAHIATHKSAIVELTQLKKITFPSFDETFSLNFDYSTRTDADKQRLWPTKPTGNGFHFLRN